MTIHMIILLSMLMLVSCSHDKVSKPKENIDRLNNNSEIFVKSKKEMVREKKENKNIYHEYKSKIFYDKEYEQIEIILDNKFISIKLIDFESYISFMIDNSYKNEYLEVDFNYIYGEDINSAIKKIRTFKDVKKDESILILPSATEEYPTYTIISFNDFGINSFHSFFLKQYDCNDFDTIKVINNVHLSVIKNSKECATETLENNQNSSSFHSDQSFSDIDSYYDYKYFENNNDYHNSVVFKEIEDQKSIDPSFYGEKNFSFGGRAAIGNIKITKENDVTITMCGHNVPEDCSIEYIGKYRNEMKDSIDSIYSISGNKIILTHAQGSSEISNLK